jgi:hypothetical protein
MLNSGLEFHTLIFFFIEGFFKFYQHVIQYAEICGCIAGVEWKGTSTVYTGEKVNYFTQAVVLKKKKKKWTMALAQ